MKKGNPTFIILLAIIFIVNLSALPLSEWSGGKVKDFSLISDIIKKTAEITPVTTSEQEQIDPELLKAMEEDEEHKEHNIPSVTDSVPEIPADTIIIHPAKAPREGELVIIEDYTISQTGLASLKNAIGNGRMARIAVVGDSYIEGDIFTQDLREKLQTAYGGEGVGYEACTPTSQDSDAR